MNIKPFLTLASERLAGTPTHLYGEEAESIQSELKPRVSSPRNRRESPAQGEAKRVQPKKKPREPEDYCRKAQDWKICKRKLVLSTCSKVIR